MQRIIDLNFLLVNAFINFILNRAEVARDVFRL